MFEYLFKFAFHRYSNIFAVSNSREITINSTDCNRKHCIVNALRLLQQLLCFLTRTQAGDYTPPISLYIMSNAARRFWFGSIGKRVYEL